MYNKNYFPTPKEVIQTMIAPYLENIRIKNILDPSAGMGAILEHLCWQAGVPKQRVYACEIDPNLKATLQGKSFKVVADDFLQYSGAMDFGLIVMNPPFDRGAEHLLKAWEIMRNGDVVCLLNAETIENPYTENRQRLAQVIEQHGTVEMLGPVFDDAARKTGVNVAMVRLSKKTEGSSATFSGNRMAAAEEIDLSSDEAGVQRRDYITALVDAYQNALASTHAMYKAQQQFALYVGTFAGEYETPKLLAAFFETSRKNGYSDAHNEFALAFQKHAWNKIFHNTRVSGLMTEKVREKFNKWREDMGGVDLNQENISMLFDAIIQQRKTIVNECIVDAFDKITGSADRRKVGEHWKTNSMYMVPEKFILPWIVENSSWGGMSLYHRKREFLDDIDRALCLVSGIPFPENPYNHKDGDIVTTANAIQAWCSNKGNPEESEFFTFKCHAKGTVHFKVKDLQLLSLFNRRACEAKGWQLPDEETFRGKSRRSQTVK